MKKLLCLMLTITLIFAFSGCGRKKQTSGTEASDKITVYTSFYAMYDLTRTIAKNTNAEIINLVPVGTEPHEWEPTASDIRELSKADGIIFNGNGMEGWTDKIKESIGDVPVLEASEYIMTINDSGITDPHVWLSPQNAKMQMNAITEFLCEIDGEYADVFRANLHSASEEIDRLDDDFKTMVNSCGKKEIIVTHGAYGYLCSVYGLQQIAVEGIAGESDPSPEKVSFVINFATDKDIRYIFYSNGESDKIARMIADELGGETAVLNSFEFDSEGRDYITIMRENLEALRLALN